LICPRSIINAALKYLGKVSKMGNKPIQTRHETLT
jgi:hypothetical protein